MISKAPYRMTPTELEILKKQLQECSDKGLIRLSTSLWEAPVLLANKKNGGKQLCIDYRELNKITPGISIPYRELMIFLINSIGPEYFQSWIYSQIIIS